MSAVNDVQVRSADWDKTTDCVALQQMLHHYACDPMGGGKALPEEVLRELPGQLANFPGSFSAIAWDGEDAVGLINCFAGFSTFRGRPLLNVHDIVVRRDQRGRGISRQLLQAAEEEARRRGCCKLTLEVLSGNQRAQEVYKGFGFMSYELDPGCGQALFMEKTL